MTPTSLFILTTCCLTAILAIVLLLWHRESRRLGASNADAEARERAAAARLSAAEARLAAAGRLEIRNALAGCLPKRLAAALCDRLALSGPVAGISPKKRRELAERLAAFPFVPSGTEGWAKAEVTAGGVATEGISSKTMEAAGVPGLFVIGETLDVTGRLGGYNLHWAFASGKAAGSVA